MFLKIKLTRNIFLYSYAIVFLSLNMSSKAETWESISSTKSSGSEIVVTEVDKASITSSGKYKFATYRVLPLEEKQKILKPDKFFKNNNYFSNGKRFIILDCENKKLATNNFNTQREKSSKPRWESFKKLDNLNKKGKLFLSFSHNTIQQDENQIKKGSKKLVNFICQK